MTTYTLRFVVCADTETVGNCGERCEEAAEAWTREACDQLRDLPFVEDADTDSHFPNWHGGKYAHQAGLYGHERFDAAVCIGAHIIEFDGEDETTSSVDWKDLPAEVRAEFEPLIWAALELAEKAAAAAQDAEDARREPAPTLSECMQEDHLTTREEEE